jgi:hypothetical protein
LAAIGLRRLRGLDDQLRTRRAHARHLLAALLQGGRLTELAYGPGDQPNYYNLVLTAPVDAAPVLGTAFAAAGLPSDSVRYGYQPQAVLSTPRENTACSGRSKAAPRPT